MPSLREDTHKKGFFLVVGPLRVYPPYTNGLVVHVTFRAKKAGFIEKSDILLSGQGGLPFLHP